MAVLGTGPRRGRLADLAKAVGDPRPRRHAGRRPDRRRRPAPHRRSRRSNAGGTSTSWSTTRESGSPKPLHETDDESLDYFLGLMLRAPFRLARDVIPHMAAGIGDHQRHVDLRRRRRSARRRLLRGQGRPHGVDHPHRLPVRAAGNPLQRRRARRHADPDGGRRLEDERFRKINTEMTPHQRLGTVDDIASTSRVPVLAGRRFHQRPDHRRGRRLEFDEVPVRLRAVSEWVAR